MIITKRSISRRTVLRGLGATMGLPLLDAMVPALRPIRVSAASPTPTVGDGVCPERDHHGQVDAVDRRRGI